MRSRRTVKHATSAAIASSANPSRFGQPVTFTATLSGGGPPVSAGTGQWKVNGSDLGTPVTVSAGGTAASVPVKDLAVGSNTITADYSGSATELASTRTLKQTVAKAVTITKLTVTATQLIAKVAAVRPGAGVPTGTVIFSIGGPAIGTATLSATGVASLAHKSSGAPIVFAVYIGSRSFADSSTLVQAPQVTSQPKSITVRALKRATFTAHASGIPAPTVKWESSSNKGKTWTVIAKATSTTYTTARLLITESGREYRAVFTNRAGKTTSKPAKLTVTKT